MIGDKVKFEQYINEMADTLLLDNIEMTKADLKKFKSKFKDFDKFLSHIQKKTELSDNDIRRLKAAYSEV